jgi:hypothetical protein
VLARVQRGGEIPMISKNSVVKRRPGGGIVVVQGVVLLIVLVRPT